MKGILKASLFLNMLCSFARHVATNYHPYHSVVHIFIYLSVYMHIYMFSCSSQLKFYVHHVLQSQESFAIYHLIVITLYLMRRHA